MKKNRNLSRLTISVVWAFILISAMMGCKKSAQQGKEAPSVQNDSGVPVDANLKQRLDDFASRPRVSGRLGLCVYDLTAGKTVYAFNENEPIPSASCMKLLSGVAGYHLLGTKYLYETSLFAKGKIINDTLHGSIIFKGSLDPDFAQNEMTFLVRSLRHNGVKGVDGNVVLDLVLKEPVQAERHWYPWDLERSKYGLLYQGENRIKSTLLSTFKAQGVRVKNEAVVVGKLPRGAQRVGRYIRTIDRVVERMWKNSSNTRATAMLYTIGNHLNTKDSAQKSGVAYLKKFLNEDIKEKKPKIVIHDGCGLCRYNRLSAKTLVDILKYGYGDKNLYDKLKKYLSLSGVDGTSRRLLAGPDLNGKLHVKTGTLSHPYGISTLAGYCDAPNGHLLAFAIMSSEMSVLDAHVLQRNLCKELVKEGK